MLGFLLQYVQWQWHMQQQTNNNQLCSALLLETVTTSFIYSMYAINCFHMTLREHQLISLVETIHFDTKFDLFGL